MTAVDERHEHRWIYGGTENYGSRLWWCRCGAYVVDGNNWKYDYASHPNLVGLRPVLP